VPIGDLGLGIRSPRRHSPVAPGWTLTERSNGLEIVQLDLLAVHSGWTAHNLIAHFMRGCDDRFDPHQLWRSDRSLWIDWV